MADISVIILTFNEEKHIARCINSLKSFAKEVFVIDSFSTDSTVSIALSQGAKVFQNKYTNQATQFNWALKTCSISTEWVMRIDADEYVLPELSIEINNKLPSLEKSISGIFIKRRLIFLNKWIKYGGNYPIWLLRIWRNGKGYCENRWIDEHIKVTEGETTYFEMDFVDENGAPLSLAAAVITCDSAGLRVRIESEDDPLAEMVAKYSRMSILEPVDVETGRVS